MSLTQRATRAGHDRRWAQDTKMDTDYLTPMAYDCIRLATDATHFLRSQLGAECGHYRGEDAYLRGILADVKEIDDDPEGYLDGMNLLDDTDIAAFTRNIRALREHIERTIGTPIADRGEPRWKL